VRVNDRQNLVVDEFPRRLPDKPFLVAQIRLDIEKISQVRGGVGVHPASLPENLFFESLTRMDS
jgi:hypothetical protein